MPHVRWEPLSAPRRMIVELMRACQGIPLVTAERRMELGDLAEARGRAEPRPAWSLLVAKAFALVAVDMPALRTSYLPFPRGRLHEHDESVAAIVVEREVDGEQAALTALFNRPHATTLTEMDVRLRHIQQAPVSSIPWFRRALRLARFPWPLRGWLMGLALFVSGKMRERHAGTFGLSSPASSGAGLANIISPLSCTLHYGLFDEQDRLDVRLTFDHRVLDGATAARALAALEKTLRGAILAEVQQMARVRLRLVA